MVGKYNKIFKERHLPYKLANNKVRFYSKVLLSSDASQECPLIGWKAMPNSDVFYTVLSNM